MDSRLWNACVYLLFISADAANNKKKKQVLILTSVSKSAAHAVYIPDSYTTFLYLSKNGLPGGYVINAKTVFFWVKSKFFTQLFLMQIKTAFLTELLE
jgi:hypothetical protein